jgi:hypothetical protein
MVRVEVMLEDGSLLERTVETPRGSEPHFASETQVVAKFEKLAAHALKRSQAARLRDAVLGMENLRDAVRLVQLMTVRKEKRRAVA